MAGFFPETIGVLNRALDLRSVRHNLISSNIANQDTPGYKAVDIDFKAALKKAEGEELPMIRTNEGHLGGISQGLDGQKANVQKVGVDEGYDKNTVNIEMEMSKMAENTLMYDALAQITAMELKGLGNAIKDVR